MPTLRQSITSGLIGQMGFIFDGNDSTANSDVAIIQNTQQSGSYADFQPGGSQSGGIMLPEMADHRGRAQSNSIPQSDAAGNFQL